MSRAYALSPLRVRITEQVTINGIDRGSSANFTIPDIQYVDTGTVTIPDVATRIFTFGGAATTRSWAASKLKYLRITNMDTSTSVDIRVAATDSYWVRLKAYQHLLLGDVGVDAQASSTAAAPSYADISTIDAKTASGTSTIEYVLALI